MYLFIDCSVYIYVGLWYILSIGDFLDNVNLVKWYLIVYCNELFVFKLVDMDNDGNYVIIFIIS